MKKVLLSLMLVTAGSIYAQVGPGYPCPIEIKSNQGGGNCTSCAGVPNTPGGDFTNATAKVVLDFGTQTVTCAPRLMMVIDKTGLERPVRCGVGVDKSVGNGNTIYEYCLFSDETFDNFFNQPDLVVVLRYDCPTGTSITVRCNNQGEVIEEIPLPVHFKSFNANRQNSNVVISWTTATEQNNKGFNVQKNVGGEWKTIAFVFSRAEGGNSSSDLTYSYKDLNNEKGITQYRIQQVDLDGHAKYSDIRAIRGEGTAAKIVVYPNPSVDGKLNVVFEDNSGVRDVQVNDMQGRIVKSYRSITNNILVIDKLASGFYTIKVTNRNTATSSVEKVVVK